jgi:hypothetical protein
MVKGAELRKQVGTMRDTVTLKVALREQSSYKKWQLFEGAMGIVCRFASCFPSGQKASAEGVGE